MVHPLPQEEEVVEAGDPVEMDQIQKDGAWMCTSGLALTTDISNTSLPIARNCADYVALLIHLGNYVRFKISYAISFTAKGI